MPKVETSTFGGHQGHISYREGQALSPHGKSLKAIFCCDIQALSFSLLPEKTPLKIPSPFIPKVETPTSADTFMPKFETSTSADTRDTSPAEKGKLCLPTERYLSYISRK
ncbi:hypothetical protein CDAR_501241 [Caerostris darwini]|uniref:Uncharacterized protein n=1 Tax=Caerostris darwini TaxID=1538125 RepID=A0AAV4NQH8_9ARAC|nr:hypothetical protein CDAR_501241 [Caerostris darwini]